MLRYDFLFTTICSSYFFHLISISCFQQTCHIHLFWNKMNSRRTILYSFILCHGTEIDYLKYESLSLRLVNLTFCILLHMMKFEFLPLVISNQRNLSTGSTGLEQTFTSSQWRNVLNTSSISFWAHKIFDKKKTHI